MRAAITARLLALALGLCLFASPAFAAFTLSFITNSAANNNTGSTHGVQTGNMTVGAGSLVIFFGDMLQMNNAADQVSVIDAVGNTYTVYQCPETAGSLNVSYVAWSILTTGLVAQKATVQDTTNGGTVIGSGGAMQIIGYTLSGAAASSPEDVSARACAGSTSSTTSPTVTSGTPTGAGEFAITQYMSPTNSSGFSYTSDAGHGWATNGGPVGSSRQVISQDKQTNAGSGALVSNPATTSAPYAIQQVAFCPTGGCAAASAGTNQGMLLRGAQ